MILAALAVDIHRARLEQHLHDFLVPVLSSLGQWCVFILVLISSDSPFFRASYTGVRKILIFPGCLSCAGDVNTDRRIGEEHLFHTLVPV